MPSCSTLNSSSAHTHMHIRMYWHIKSSVSILSSRGAEETETRSYRHLAIGYAHARFHAKVIINSFQPSCNNCAATSICIQLHHGQAHLSASTAGTLDVAAPHIAGQSADFFRPTCRHLRRQHFVNATSFITFNVVAVTLQALVVVGLSIVYTDRPFV